MAGEIDRDKLEAWLKEQPISLLAKVLARAYARDLPFFIANFIGRTSSVNQDLKHLKIAVVLTVISSGDFSKAALREKFGAMAEPVRYLDSMGRIEPGDPPKHSIVTSFEIPTNGLSFGEFDYATEGMAESQMSTEIREQFWADTKKLANSVKLKEEFLPERMWPVSVQMFLLKEWRAEAEEALSRQKSWGFWYRFYRSFLGATKIDLRVLTDVALIPDNDWETGPDRVAKLISAIEAKYAAKPLEKEVVTQRSQALVAHSEMSGETLEGIGEGIEDFIAAQGWNETPEELEALPMVPATFKRIAKILRGAGTQDEKVTKLEGEITRLHTEIQKLRADLSDSRSKSVSGTFTKTFLEEGAKRIWDPKFWGLIWAGSYAVFGDWSVGGLLNGLQSEVDGLIQSPPELEADNFPSVKDVLG